jgi:DNA polymerase I-like protein with 3'-5' exonuclease and polymerase domains
MIHSNGVITSAFKKSNDSISSYGSMKAKELWDELEKGNKGCKASNGASETFAYGLAQRYKFEMRGAKFEFVKYDGDICGVVYEKASEYLYTVFAEESDIPLNIPYVKLTVAVRKPKNNNDEDSDLDDVPVRSVEEIKLTKESIDWLKNKDYRVVTDDMQAEAIFTYLDTFNYPISYDTETTGLRINMFGKINSKEADELAKYNEEHPKEKIKADALVGIIFCVQQDVSYYFPCGNRKFKNLYDELDSPVRAATIARIRAEQKERDPYSQTDIGRLLDSTPDDELTSDVILMLRVRNILETKHIVAHNGIFEWKVGWLYEIDTNLTDDTMILHQLMYKFRSTTSNRGEPSALKFLAMREFGIEQWELSDFFPGFAEDEGAVRAKKGAKKKKKSLRIDFSYMDLEGTKIYAPADGDVTMMLLIKYKTDLIKNHHSMEHIYNIEVRVSCAIAYMEFYGHKLDLDKVEGVRSQVSAEVVILESQIRELINFSSADEKTARSDLEEAIKVMESAEKEAAKEAAAREDFRDTTRIMMAASKAVPTPETERLIHSSREKIDKLKLFLDSLTVGERDKKLNEARVTVDNLVAVLKATIEDSENSLLLSSPAQVGELFYDKLGIPLPADEKKSVAKKVIKSLKSAKDEDGNNKYPVVHLYSDYKAKDTLVTKFFDNLQYFTYPGGYIFSSYGQISTATGRMSCRQPNAQQYPKQVTKIIVPRPGCSMIDADYSQIEYRVLVRMAEEQALLEKFKDPDNDYHTMMASLMFSKPYASVTSKMRSDAKSFNFGIPYGMGFKSLAILLTGRGGEKEKAEAKEKYELYFKEQPNVRKFFARVKEAAAINKYTETFWHRTRFYSFLDKDGNVSQKLKGAAQRQAGNAVIQGTAADIFKIAVGRMFTYIRANKLFGKMFITNMIHDEILFEVDVSKLNYLRVLHDIADRMQFEVQGFPPLFIGAGLGPSWAVAKDKMAEIHPHMLDEICLLAESISLYNSETETLITNAGVLADIQKRILDFRTRKITSYLTNEANQHTQLNPAIGSLLNLQFRYDVPAPKSGASDAENNKFTMALLSRFIEEEKVPVKSEWWTVGEITGDDDDEVEYDDGDEEEDGFDFDDSEFQLIEEDGKMYGADLNEIIALYGLIVYKEKKVCGIDMRDISFKKKEQIIEYLDAHKCYFEDEGSMQVMFLKDNNILSKTGVYVNGIEGKSMSAELGLASMYR